MNLDYTKPVEIAQDVYWVGYVIPNDPFQCHVYLIKNGSNSILIDPGSKITWSVTRNKILSLMDLDDIKYFICHHQDPDITACMSDIFQEVGTKDKFVVTHWRTKALLVHYDWGVEFIEVESNDFKLNIPNRPLEFIFTPYMHFPGAICTYDLKTKTLFSSDIFGGFTKEFSLYADDAKSYFEKLKPFHEHYMPSNEILKNGLSKIEKLDIEQIAPQHGSIIKKELIPYIIQNLKNLDVGLYLTFEGHKDIQKLSKANEVISSISKIAIYETMFFEHIGEVIDKIKQVVAIERILAVGFGKKTILFDSVLPKPIPLDASYKDTVLAFNEVINSKRCSEITLNEIFEYKLKENYKVFAFAARDFHETIIGLLFFAIESNALITNIDLEILENVKSVIEPALHKAIEVFEMEEEKNEFFDRSIRDGLTGLFNKRYFDMTADIEFQKARRYNYPLSLAFIDLDNFKKVNDTFGHDIGDIVLKDFAKNIAKLIRSSDSAFRYGGEEFVILFPHTTKNQALEILTRIQNNIKSKSINVLDKKIQYTFSGGIAELSDEQSYIELVKKADQKMYEAKATGKDKIVT